MSSVGRAPVVSSGTRWEGALPALLTGIGLALIAVTVAQDVFNLSDPAKFSWRQLMAILAGLGFLLNGLELRNPESRQRLASWWKSPLTLRLEAAAKYSAVLVQLGLLLFVLRRFEMENQAFYGVIAVLAFGGFALHCLVPESRRLAFFVAASLAGVLGVLGTLDGLWLIAIGIVLIGLGRLPAPFGVRLALIFTAAAALAVMRTEWIEAPWSRAVWPTLGALFMFRMIVYVYELRHARQKPGFTESVGYFFLLPNVVFPLFPVVDFSAFRRTYYDSEQFAIYQTGVKWMMRGVVHLMLYRFVYQFFTIAPNEVAAPADLFRFMVANYLLYIRVSGQFHLITGMLHLFGFNLPLTNNNYYLASGFSDSWRRMNIYWKDFMMKVVFYPAYFTLKRLGDRVALALGTVIVIFVTWALHAYQWFWLLGDFPLASTDMLFWGVLGLLLVSNTLWEAAHGRRRDLEPESWSLRSFAGRLARTTATFAVLSLLWSLWVSPTLADWFALFRIDWTSVGLNTLGIPLGVVAALGLGILYTDRRSRNEGTEASDVWAYMRRAAAVSVALGIFWVAGSPGFAARLGSGVVQVADLVRIPQLNQQDAVQVQRGYYENLMGVSQLNSQLWEVYMNEPLDLPGIEQTAAGRRVDGYLTVELVPNGKAVLRGALMTINRWAMRDRDYEMVKAPGTLRLALIGPSVSMGWAVRDDETFENLLEDRLNDEPGRLAPYDRVESLNFSVPGYVPIQYVALVERALEFDPDVLLLSTSDNDVERTIGRVAYYAVEGVPFPGEAIQALGASASEGFTTRPPVERNLKAHDEEIIRYYYREIAELCLARGVRPVLLFIPALERQFPVEEKELLLRVAAETGFDILDLSDVYSGIDIREHVIGHGDFHPNPRGHRLIADRLYKAFVENPSLLSPRAAAR